MRRRFWVWLAAVLLICMALPIASAAEQTKLVALTFDDGPSAYTERLLDGLEQRNVQGTFFVQGIKAEKNPELIRRMVAEGHQLANHSYDHPDLSTLTLEEAMAQLTVTDEILNRITGGSVAYHYRAPYGRSTPDIRKQLEAPIYYWTIDCQDWVDKSRGAIRTQLLNQISDGFIVLIHDTVKGSVEATLDAIDILQEQGYEFVTLKELFRRRGVPLQNTSQYYSCLPTDTLLPAFQTPEIQAEGTQEALQITLESPDGLPIYYSVDGSDLLLDAQRYTEPITVSLPCTIRAVAAADLNGSRSDELRITYWEPPADEPEIKAGDGCVILSLGTDGEDLYFRRGDEKLSHVVFDAEEDVRVPMEPNTWIYCYADGAELNASQVKTLLYTEQGNLFSDVEEDAWYYEAMDRAAAKGYITSTGDTYEMEPDALVTREMLADMMYRFSGASILMLRPPFEDVDFRSPYAKGISWACKEGLFTEDENGGFNPTEPVTRQELAKVLATYLGDRTELVSLDYRDLRYISSWARSSVSTVTALKLMEGSNGYFNPWGTVSRGEAAVILMRLDALNK